MRTIFLILLSIFISKSVLAETPMMRLPEIALIDVDHEEVRLSDHRDTTHIINFWATWCAPCVHELPSLAKLAHHYANNDRVQLVLVNEDFDFQKAQAFLQDFDFPARALQLFDTKGKFLQAIDGKGLPITLIVDPKGDIVRYTQGAQDWNTTEVYALLDGLSHAPPEQNYWWQKIVMLFTDRGE